MQPGPHWIWSIYFRTFNTVATYGRRAARICAVQALYQWRITEQPASDIESQFITDEKLVGTDRDFFRMLITEIPTHIKIIDQLISPHLDRTAANVDYLAQAILRLGTYELKFTPDIPLRVVLDEAVTIAKIFCADNGYKYVNAVLDKVAGQVRVENSNEIKPTNENS